METLKQGSKGGGVSTWQLFLRSRGLDIVVDGHFGATTVSVTKVWQERAGVSPTGELDALTLETAVKYGFKMTIIQKPIDKPAFPELAIFADIPDKINRINAAALAKVAPVIASRVVQMVEEALKDGVVLQVVQGLRTIAEQDALYAQGRTKPGQKVTNARGGQSMHNYGLAVDLAPVIDGKVSWNERHFRAYREWSKNVGLEWGGNWKSFVDLPHVQDTEGMNLAAVQKLYRAGGLQAVWNAIK